MLLKDQSVAPGLDARQVATASGHSDGVTVLSDRLAADYYPGRQTRGVRTWMVDSYRERRLG